MVKPVTNHSNNLGAQNTSNNTVENDKINPANTPIAPNGKNSKPTIDGQKPKFNKLRTTSDTFATVTLVIQIIVTIGLGGLALAPVLNVFFGLCLFCFVVFGVVITTAGTLGIAWSSQGFRNFWGNTWNFMIKTFTSAETIKNTFKGSIIWISILMLVISSVGFIYNLIYFIKTKNNKTRFIASCIFLGLAIINLVVALGMYLS